MVIMAVGQSECPLLASCRLTATGQSPVLHFLGGVAKAICIFEPIAVLIALVAENQGTTEHTEHTEARDNRLRVVFRGRVEGNWYLSNHHKTLGKRPKVRFLSSPLKNPGFPRVFRISAKFLWLSCLSMHVHASRCCVVLCAALAPGESSSESPESSPNPRFSRENMLFCSGGAGFELGDMHAQKSGFIFIINVAGGVSSAEKSFGKFTPKRKNPDGDYLLATLSLALG